MCNSLSTRIKIKKNKKREKIKKREKKRKKRKPFFIKLKTKKGSAFHQKTDIFRRIIWYSYEGEGDVFIPLKVERVKEIMEMNVKGEFPDELQTEVKLKVVEKKNDYENVVGQDSLTRFDRSKQQQHQNRKRTQGQTRPNQNKTSAPNPNNSNNKQPKANINKNRQPNNRNNNNPNKKTD